MYLRQAEVATIEILLEDILWKVEQISEVLQESEDRTDDDA